MRRIWGFIAVIVIVFCSLSSCRSPYTGRTITLGTPSICSIGALPATCTFEDNNFTIDYQIAETIAPGKYTIDARATYHGSLTWEYYRNGVMTLLLIKNGVIEETVSVSLARGALEDGIHFSRSLATQSDFDAVSIAYTMDVSDRGGGFGIGMKKMDIVTGTIRSRPIR